eukprot:CAMPEP_0114225332 /NCGR_PEP_ID=MMETSP0058-20121206/605_1 /TAXON_ID=36894 /ORGANISM="Pyramimonas parkeae, CCMP726" /LENGTH=360 /DNA_ID=CAMNT_0001335909 /DNA_START=168 /DNA_END=1250 /DNA_ORIENTATION=-
MPRTIRAVHFGQRAVVSHASSISKRLSSPGLSIVPSGKRISTRRMNGSEPAELKLSNARQAPARVFASSSDAEQSTDQSALPDDGYTLATTEEGRGGWLQHRLAVDRPASGPGCDWIQELMDDHWLQGAVDFVPPGQRMTHKPRILVLYGSLRERSFSRFLALECARLMEAMGADVRVFNPSGLPPRDPTLENHPKVQELRALTLWSEGHVWVSPEMHGTITGVFKNQIDWIPLNTGSVRPTQGRTAVVLQVNGGSQSFNAVNELRKLARWMRMPCSTNQSSVAKAWQEFDEDGRMKPSDFRDRVVDVMEEFHKFTLLMREHSDVLVDRYSERKEKQEKGRLLSQKEKEAAKETAATNSS